MSTDMDYLIIGNHLLNKDSGSSSQRSHLNYALSKLNQKHSLGDYQLVVVDHMGNIDLDFTEKFVDLSPFINGEARYHLLSQVEIN